MGKKISVLIDNDWVLIVANENIVYQKTREEFKKELGIEIPYMSVDYNLATGYSKINGVKFDRANDAWVDDVIYRLDIKGDPVEDEPKSNPMSENDIRIMKLRGKLASTDYVVLKIAEGEATKEEYAAILSDRKIWRAEINALEKTNG